MAKFKKTYKEALSKTQKKKDELSEMYFAALSSGFPVEGILQKEAARMPGILAREYLDFLAEAIDECDGLTEEDFEEFADEISLYQRYYDALDRNGNIVRDIDIDWSELPKEAKLSFIKYPQ